MCPKVVADTALEEAVGVAPDVARILGAPSLDMPFLWETPCTSCAPRHHDFADLKVQIRWELIEDALPELVPPIHPCQ